ncbi:MAG: ferrochelatase [Acidobacteria bacterium]|nr:ferrochelatase [Acidobacteriota bacterium]
MRLAARKHPASLYSDLNFDALLVLSFGGPEMPADVLPFLENVLRGRNVPPERLLEVAGHYHHFGGKSPINDQTRALVSALRAELAAHGPRLPVYWGNRNWHPFLAGALRQMSADGVRRALCFVTSAFGSYSGCRQYREDIARAQAEAGSQAPEVEKLRAFHNHPGFIEAVTGHCREAMSRLSSAAHLVFTAHSIPVSMARDSPYAGQIQEACSLVASGLGRDHWSLVYQSRSGPPGQPWLEPDIGDYLRHVPAPCEVVVVPIGFLSDHMEVLYDLDHEARLLAESRGIRMVRAATVGVHPRFVSMIRDLVLERVENALPAAVCAEDCCPGAPRPS